MNFNHLLSILLIFGKLFSFVIVLLIIRNSKSLNKDIPWIVLILLFPLIGSLIYLILGSNIIKSNLLKRISKSIDNSKKYFYQDDQLKQEILSSNNNTLMYLSKHCNFLVTPNNRVIYYPTGEIFFEKVKEELKNAKKFIFIEFFSLATGILWGEILKILKEKVREGVEVRLIYDNTACRKKNPPKYYKQLASLGILCEPYYKKNPLIGMLKNHRDHRKCIIIDGRISFTGGVNIEDKYINLEQPYGYWKDVGISIEGDGVWSFTIMFLSMWSALQNQEEDYTKYKNPLISEFKNSGFAIPFGDNPLDQENIGKNTYINLIHQAKNSLYIFTPYLILDMDIYNALTLAAKRGVAVKIIIPGIPDKKSVYQVSLLNARKLLKEKVKVYTYTPGFMHGKVFLVDNTTAIVGTINTDYRSLYLDFEYGVFIQDVNVIEDIKQDIENTLQKSVELKPVTTNFIHSLYEAILQLIAPLM